MGAGPGFGGEVGGFCAGFRRGYVAPESGRQLPGAGAEHAGMACRL
jgi:hypothetical protein